MNITMEGKNMETHQLLFGWCDFTVFGMMLAVSTAIGVYFGFWKKQGTKLQYLLGGKTMSITPVATSLVASYISGVTLMGVPSEIYTYGTLYVLVCVANIVVALLMNYVFLPVFFELQLTSTYEYMEMRFNKSVRLMSSALYTISAVLFMPIVIYVPALGFSQVSDFSVHVITPIISIICIFYTMIGGMKAVVWTDFIQTIVMLGSCFAVVILGVYNVGGFEAVFERSYQGGRLQLFEMDPSVTARNTFWTVLIGTILLWTNNSINQGTIQKYMTLPNLRSAKIGLIIFCVGIIVMKCLSIFTGLIIYATYKDCDPLKSQIVKRADQLLVHFVMDTAGMIPGLPGLFIAGVFSAALSTLSSILNCLAATVFEDFIKPFLREKEDERRDGYIMKAIVLVVGVVGVFLVYVVEKLGTIMQVSYSIQGITAGALIGLFILGVFFPWANSKGALWGSISSLILVGVIAFGAQHAQSTGILVHKSLPVSVEGCAHNFTAIEARDIHEEEREEAFFLFRISYWYYSLIGALTVVIVGMTVSVVTGLENPSNMNQSLLAPFLRKYTKKHEHLDVDIKESAEKCPLTDSVTC